MLGSVIKRQQVPLKGIESRPWTVSKGSNKGNAKNKLHHYSRNQLMCG